MKSIRQARVVVVVASDQGLLLAARLRRMDVAQVIEVVGLREAAAVCRSGHADTCIVALDDMVPDTTAAELDAPGRNCGVPTLLVVPAVTTYERRRARRRGYIAVVAAAIPPRLFYRRLGGALQRRRAERRKPRRSPSPGVPILALPRMAASGKPTLH